MSASQFTRYSSLDAAGPGPITGAVGSALAVLDACLVNGYTGKAAAGWTKPFANSGNIGCYQQGAGSGLNLLINDNGPTAANEAIGTGWETLAGIGSPVGSGTGQFPLPAQLLTNGHFTLRKSSTASSTGRYWQLAADASTFYLWVITGDSTAYYAFWFGDIFSLYGASDAHRCMILGGTTDNAGTASAHYWDCVCRQVNGGTQPSLYAARPWTDVGGSVFVSRTSDTAFNSSATDIVAMAGVIGCPNAPDQSAILAPIRLADSPYTACRGRFRGLYQVCHPSSSFSDGQIIDGGNEYAGKQFQIIKAGPNGGYLALEISATVETN